MFIFRLGDCLELVACKQLPRVSWPLDWSQRFDYSLI